VTECEVTQGGDKWRMTEVEEIVRLPVHGQILQWKARGGPIVHSTGSREGPPSDLMAPFSVFEQVSPGESVKTGQVVCEYEFRLNSTEGSNKGEMADDVIL